MTKDRASVLITGGAGFIGSHLTDELIAAGHRVRVLDSLCAQVHGEDGAPPTYLHPDAELIVGDLRNRALLESALEGVDAVFHFAARVGVGQSMYRVADYVASNDVGTAVLMESLSERPLRRLVVASSMSVYGEGAYEDADGAPFAAARDEPQLRAGHWDPVDDEGRTLRPRPTAEDKPADLSSVYALTKYAQERLCLMLGRAYGIPCVALRFFNVYGERQALSNPYTGVLAIFAARLLNGRPPLLFEDGEQRRDFVHVSDVVRACRLAMEAPGIEGEVINIGSGHAITVREVAGRAARALGIDIEPETTGRHRRGDIRHCYADVSRARELLGFEAGIDPATGIPRLAAWLRGQQPRDLSEHASAELRMRGLAV